MNRLHLPSLAVLLVSSSLAHGQSGADGCATPDLLVGTGVFSFDNTLATTGTEGQSEALCNVGTSLTVVSDVWFLWTSPITGTAVVETCGLSTVDTKIAVYAGSTCPTSGSAVACEDNNCPFDVFSTTLRFAVSQGASYVIQLGVSPETIQTVTPGIGQFSISTQIPPANDSCATPSVLIGPGSYVVDNTGATTGVQGQAESLCNQFGFTTVVNDVWFAYTATASGPVRVTTCGVALGSPNEDSKIAVYSGFGCPSAGTALACNDDQCSMGSGFESTITFSATCGNTYMIQFGMYGGSTALAFYTGGMDLVELGVHDCSTTSATYCFGDGTGTACPCGNNGAPGNGCANSVHPSGAHLSAFGSSVVGSDTWRLVAQGVPNGAGLYFQGTAQFGGGAGVAFGDGLLCTGGAIIRIGVVFGIADSSAYPSPNPPASNQVPISVVGLVNAGDTRYYQLWYRDAISYCTAASYNLTNGVSTTW